jgi:hypothetical protein
MAASGPRFWFIPLGTAAEYVDDGSGYFRLSDFKRPDQGIDQALAK